MDEQQIDLRNKKEEELINIYNEIAQETIKDIEVFKMKKFEENQIEEINSTNE